MQTPKLVVVNLVCRRQPKNLKAAKMTVWAIGLAWNSLKRTFKVDINIHLISADTGLVPFGEILLGHATYFNQIFCFALLLP